MEMQYFKEYSPELGRDMECKLYGHAGRPMLYIPCQDGRFFDFENFHMTDTLAPWIESGQIMVLSIDTMDQETWSDEQGNPYWRIRRYEQWLRYITREFDSLGMERFEQRRDLDTLINLDVTELGRINELIQTMKIGELNRFLEQQRQKGSDSIRIIEVERHARFVYPISTFILTLIGVSLSSRKVRGGTGLHIGLGVGLCFSYILLMRFFEEFAKSGTLPTGLSMWIPNILYCFIAIYLYKKAPK